MKKLFLSFYLLLTPLVAKPLITVSIPPQAYFVEKIADSSVDINILVPQNSDEHNLDFKPKTIENLEKSDIYFTTGLEFEKPLIEKFKDMFKNLLIVDTTKDIPLMSSNFSHEHHHNKYKQHEHQAQDPHVWLDPILVKSQAQIIAKALSEKYPQNKAMYESNLERFQNELIAIDARIREELEGLTNRQFIIYHPSWGYFAKRYNLVQVPVEIGGKEPKIRDLQKIITLCKQKNIKVIFTQVGFPDSATKMLAKECGANVASLNHLSKDWERELLKSAQELSKALKN